MVRSRTLCQIGMGWRTLCHRHTYLYLACPTSLYNHVCLGELLCLLMCCLQWRQSSVPHFLHCSLAVPTRTATFDYVARAGCAGSDGVEYSTSQPALLRLPAHFRRISHISRPTGEMHNALHNPYPQTLAICCVVLSLLRPNESAIYFPPASPLYPPKM